MSHRYDPELPFLDELEAEISRVAAARLGAVETVPPEPEPAARPVRRRRSPWGRAWARIPRRAAVLALMGCLVGATATATVRLLDENAPSNAVSAPVVVERASDPEPRELTLHGRGGELCSTLVLPATVDTTCQPPPGADGGFARSAVSGASRYVYGVTGRRVVEVDVRVGGQRVRAATRALPASAVALEGRGRWFVAVLDRPAGARDPVAEVRLYTREQPSPAATLLDCSLGQLDARCSGS
jgi:hypothetical protein